LHCWHERIIECGDFLPGSNMKILRNFIDRSLNRRLADDQYVNAGYHLRTAWLAEKADKVPRGSRVLDAGAGKAPYRDLFAHCDYKTHDFGGYEGTPDGPQKQDWTYSKLDYVSDITSIPVADGCFDVVVCTEVLEHVPHPIDALREFSRILGPQGTLLLSAPLGSGLHQRPYHYYGGFTPHFYEKFLPQAGFNVMEITPTGGLMKHAGQMLYKVGALLEQMQPERLPAWLKYLLMCDLPRRIGSMDAKVFIEEFTTGYCVEARKQ